MSLTAPEECRGLAANHNKIFRFHSVFIVCCTGRITSETTQALKTWVKPLFPESKRVVLDLTAVNYVDSSGLGAIIGLYVSAKLANCQLKVTYSNESLKGLFGITRLDQLLADGA